MGTSTTQMIISEITVENQASGFTVPEMTITGREILYKSPVCNTPLKGHNLVDGDAIGKWVLQEYAKAGISRQKVDTGAVIITGETSRKENAAAVLQALSDFAGDFVVATAGPDLESVLAAKGAGATGYSQKTGKTVLHMDIGGGTSNLALITDGEIVRTGCLNVGGRLLKLDGTGKLTYVSPVLKKLCDLQVGDRPSDAELTRIAQLLCSALEMAAGRKEKTELLDILATDEAQNKWEIPPIPVTVSFSGGVADCIEKFRDALSFGDIGPILGREIHNSSLCRGEYYLSGEPIRATVIGAGSHSTQLSGSTVFNRNAPLPQKNLPVICFSKEEQQSRDFAHRIGEKIARSDSREVVLAIPGYESPDYQAIGELAEKIIGGVGERNVYLCVQTDMAKALGQRISLLLPDRPCLCLDKLKLSSESFLDIGLPVGPCFPVVIKTLILRN